ncbi:MAG TPA: hypothetical protein VFV08_07900 [Puia sp.]|nr:hypothetical protein [Puia sp.]
MINISSLVIYSFFMCFGLIVNAQSNADMMRDMKAKADAIKKNSPAQKNSKPGLPAGYDNSWKVTISLTRSMQSMENLTSKGTGCKSTKNSATSFDLHASFSTDKMIGVLNGDDIQMFTNVDESVKAFVHPLSGSYSYQSSGSGTEINCGDKTTSQYSGQATIDPSKLYFSFDYNKKTKKGNYNVTIPDDYNLTATGTMTACTKGQGCNTVNISDLAKTEIKMLYGICGPFAAWNYDLSKDANTEKMLELSPVNGEKASIVETKYGFEISYSQTKTVENPISDNYTGTSKATFTTSLHISITDQDPIQYDAIVESLATPDGKVSGDYENWIPKGPAISDNAAPGDIARGNSIGFRVYLVDKKDPSKVISGEDYDVDCKLTVQSKEPGICNNYPLNSYDKKEDILIDSVLAKSNYATYSTKEVKTHDYQGKGFIFVLTSYDYGSFAKMTVTVTLKYGSQLQAHFKSDKKTVIPVPKDDNDNQIADAWEKSKDVNVYDKNYNSFWDGEKQKVQGKVVNDNDGDGLTLYEEYRGVVVKGQHMRLDPNKKELFVLNKLGDKGKPGMDLFSGASGIKVIELADKDVDYYDRVINPNSDFARMGKQHAIILKEYSTSSKGVMGYTPNVEGTDDPPTSPADCPYVGINLGYPFKGNDFVVTVAHEMGHSCGVHHHGKLADMDPPDKSSISQLTIYSSNFTKIGDEGMKQLEEEGIQGTIAGSNSQSSGDMYCIMCYDDEYDWSSPDPDHKTFIHIAHNDQCDKTHFCDSKAGTYLNKASDKHPSVYGEAGNGECIKQFKVKDW